MSKSQLQAWKGNYRMKYKQTVNKSHSLLKTKNFLRYSKVAISLVCQIVWSLLETLSDLFIYIVLSFFSLFLTHGDLLTSHLSQNSHDLFLQREFIFANVEVFPEAGPWYFGLQVCFFLISSLNLKAAFNFLLVDHKEMQIWGSFQWCRNANLFTQKSSKCKMWCVFMIMF